MLLLSLINHHCILWESASECERRWKGIELTDVTPVPDKPKTVTSESPPVNVKEDEIESEAVPNLLDLTDGEPNTTNHILKG